MCFLWQNSPLFMNSRKNKYNFIRMGKISKDFCLICVEIFPKFSTNQNISGCACISCTPSNCSSNSSIQRSSALLRTGKIVTFSYHAELQQKLRLSRLFVLWWNLSLLNHHAIVQLPVEVGCHTLRMPLSLRFMGKPTVEGICRLLLRTLLYPGQYVVSKIYKYYIKHLKKVLIV